MSDAIQTVLAGFASFLRYIASGFVGLALCLVAYTQDPMEIVSARFELVAVVGILLGVTINSLHVVFLEDVAALLVQQLWYLPYLRRRLPAAMCGLGPIERFRAIEAQRLRRRASKEGPAKRFQDDHDAFAATLTFLYCSSYPAFLVAFYRPHAVVAEACTLALCLGGLFLGAALIGEMRFIGLDVWGANTYPQRESGETRDPIGVACIT